MSRKQTHPAIWNCSVWIFIAWVGTQVFALWRRSKLRCINETPICARSEEDRCTLTHTVRARRVEFLRFEMTVLRWAVEGLDTFCGASTAKEPLATILALQSSLRPKEIHLLWRRHGPKGVGLRFEDLF